MFRQFQSRLGMKKRVASPFPLMNQAKDKEFYRAEDLAKKLDVNIMTIYRYIKSGKLKAHKLGKEFRIESAELERFLKMTSTK